jgi:CMP-N,N'-diacetyllegionaminic acid synthase
MRVNNGILEPFFSDHGLDKRSQELDTAFIPNGVIYLFSPAILKLSGKIFAERNIPLIMPGGKESIDIDTEEDFFMAECYAKYQIARN